ncbi:MAG: hypothetical protein AMXMBFR84_11040 [Candidatus Hydrogenedentota bacterium]
MENEETILVRVRAGVGKPRHNGGLLLFAPGEGYEYTTHGYLLLGAAVE